MSFNIEHRQEPRSTMSSTVHMTRKGIEVTGQVFSSFDHITIKIDRHEFTITIGEPFVNSEDHTDPYADWQPGDGIKLFKAAVTNMVVKDYRDADE